MFPRLITRYGLATHLALLASLPFVLYPFLSATRLAEVIFWLSGITFLWLLVEPSMRAGEHLSIARRRVMGSLVRDVALWFFVCALAVSFVRYVNSGVAQDWVQVDANSPTSMKGGDAHKKEVDGLVEKEFKPLSYDARRNWLDKLNEPDFGLKLRAATFIMLKDAEVEEGEVLSRVNRATDRQVFTFARRLAGLGGTVKGDMLRTRLRKLGLPQIIPRSEWIVREPAYAGLPASAGSAGLLPFAVLLGVCVVVLGIRHGIGLTGRISFGLTASFVMGLGGLLMAVLTYLQVPAFMGAAKADFLEGPFRAPFWGAGFGAWLICAIAFGAQAEARKWGVARMTFCLAVAGNACGLFFFSPPPVTSVFLGVAALVAIFCLAYLSRAGSVGACARNFVLLVLGFATPFFMSAILPDVIEFDGCVRKNGSSTEPVKEPVQNIYSMKAGGFLAIDKEQSEEYRKLAPVLSDLAKTLWKKHLWYGAGTGAFRLHVPFIATKEQQDSFEKIRPKEDEWRSLLIRQQTLDKQQKLAKQQGQNAQPKPNSAQKRAKEANAKNADDFDWKALRPYNPNPVCAFNSYWTFLAERGLLGVSLALLGFGVLLVSYFVRMTRAVSFLRNQDDADIVVFACPPIVWVTPVVLVLLGVLALYEPILDIVPMLFVFTVPLAIAAASFPKNPAKRQAVVQPLVKEEKA